MRIDAYTHFFPKKFFDTMLKSRGNTKTWASACALFLRYTTSTRARRSSTPTRTMRRSSPIRSRPSKAGQEPAADRRIRPHHQRRFRRIMRQGAPVFSGLDCADIAGRAGRRRRRGRARDQPARRARRADLHQRRRQADRPAAISAVLGEDERTRQAGLAASARGADIPDYSDEKKSLYEIWWTFGWSYETGAAMARLVFSKIIDNHPNLKIITHHFGGIVPMLEGRIGPGWDVLGSRTTDEDYVALRKSLKKRPLDYFKQDFYADTAVFGAVPATKCGLEFYPRRQGRVCVRLPVRSGKRARCIRARPCAFSTRSSSTRRRATRFLTRTSNASPARNWCANRRTIRRVRDQSTVRGSNVAGGV